MVTEKDLYTGLQFIAGTSTIFTLDLENFNNVTWETSKIHYKIREICSYFNNRSWKIINQTYELW